MREMERTDGRVLVVDDDPAMGKVLAALLTQAGIASVHVLSGAEALAELARSYFDLVVTDLVMPGMDGMELLRRVRMTYPEIPVIMISAHAKVPNAVEAMKAGAADFVLKDPFEREDFLGTVGVWLTAALGQAEKDGEPASGANRLVGIGPKMQETNRLLRKAAAGTATVLLRGETGVGKDVAAHMLHDESNRRNGPLTTVHCAALPEGLLENELFGSKKGAYTDAPDRPGRVELTAGGTLFLDEIGDLTLTMQVKLLKLLQDKTFERLGDSRVHRADVRFVAATHRDLESRVASGEFREDLFYRLNVMQIWIPPLRERREAIEPLVREFCATFGKEANRPGLRIAPAAMALLRDRDWPGNVRQLRNFIERLTILAEDEAILAADVERELERDQPLGSGAVATSLAAGGGQPGFPALDVQRSEAERGHIVSAMELAHGSKTIAAKLLGIGRRTLYNKLHAYGMLGTPAVEAFIAAPTVLPSGGGRSTLSWTVRDAKNLQLEPMGGSVTGLASKEVAVTGTTTFRLVAKNDQGQAASTVTVTVGPSRSHAGEDQLR
jgi:two-component system, NtrC family, response regulator AtoC